MMKLAFSNFRRSFKSYLSLILSLSFAVLVFLNLQTIRCSDLFDGLSKGNSENIETIVQVIQIVLGCFMFFFVWYATNVFLTNRKREIGIYVFMGLSNQRIGKLYMIETAMIGIASLALGLTAGVSVTYLFQMILLAISQISVKLEFSLKLQPVLVTSLVFAAIYGVFILKGYVSIVRSSVLSLLSAAKQNEYVRQNRVLLLIRAILGTGVLAAGYYLAVKEGGMEVFANVTGAVVLVIAGVYLLFGGMIPLILQGMAKNKRFLYRKQRVLWVNSIIFRMKKNYRAYAMVCVLGICSVTALATSFAMKYRYNGIINFRNTYTFQLLSAESGLDEEARAQIEKEADISYGSVLPVLQLVAGQVKDTDNYGNYLIASYSKVKALAEDTGLAFDFAPPESGRAIKASHMYLMSLITDKAKKKATILGHGYEVDEETTTPYLGYLQEQMSFYILSDEDYEKLLPSGQELYTYNYKISDPKRFTAVRDSLDLLVNSDPESFTGRVAVDPQNSDIDWIRILYSLGIFLFLVFVLASGSIMFMRVYNDAALERERCQVLRKTGCGEDTLRKSIACEVGVSYFLPFLVMAVSARFSVMTLEKMMFTSLFPIYVGSMLVVLGIFVVCYLLSVAAYWRSV